MEHYIYVFVPSWQIAYINMCVCVRSIMEHYIYVFVPSWHFTYVCSIMAHYTIMKNWKWVFVNCDENKSCISTAAEFLKMCQDGTDA